ncbi:MULTISPECIES: cation-translocating P-type ATPase [Cryobacterium]|uniref:Cation-translocating P-type ATPase n=1 Tax=Cryobacterium breve TaxID=1259258 RepID=A0ABY2IV45_9MICO|nr:MULTISPECIES: cation-translocating P-type ATPase [Cryobacterium]TFC93576.1 cation-translocating P-type ATPase [Cryobacterium sp. TmT3-12]TFC95369.1 cation-translocating P-type ATPase [Cryobacterium breve]
MDALAQSDQLDQIDRLDVDPALADATEIARRLETDLAHGLTASEAARRLTAEGPNELRAVRPVPVWQRILAQFNDPLIYLLLVATTVSIGAWLIEGAQGLPVDAIVIAAIVVLNAVLGLVQEARADNAVAALSTMTAAASTVMRDGLLTTLPSTKLVRGDLLVLGEGDSVGADARLTEANSLRIAEASLTGESEAVTKNPRTLPAAAPLGDRLNMVFKGTAVSQGVGRGIVTGTGMNTEVGAIAGMLERTEAHPTPLQVEIGHIGKLLSIVVIVIAIVVMLTIVLVQGVSTPTDFVIVFLLGVSLAVAAVPEGLPAILSVILSIGVQRMARQNAVVKNLKSVETLGSASVICCDKTGTLTRNEMTIQQVLTASGRVDVTGVGYRPDGEVLQGDAPLTDPALRYEAQLVLGAGSLAGNAQLAERNSEWEIQGDPTEAAFLVAAAKLEGTTGHMARFDRLDEVPFTSERKMMSTLHQETSDGSLRIFSKGAPDVLLERCTSLQIGMTVVPLTDERRQRMLADIQALSAQAFRTLGVAYSRADENTAPLDEADEHGLIYAGVVGIIDPPRIEVTTAIAQAHRAGVRVVMITGDHPATAARIASDLGIVEPGAPALAGADLDRLDEPGLRDAVRGTSVFARVSPHHKLRIVDALQANGDIVAMTGDGVNDAPALKSADIGVAMGITGTEVTKEAAKIILVDDNFATIVAAVRGGRVILDNIKKFLRYLLSSNMGEVLTVFLGVLLSGVLGLAGASSETVVLPLLVTQILWINLITDSGPALAMGVDPEIDDVMARPPRPIHERMIDLRMWMGIMSTGLVMAAVTLATIDLFLPGGLLPALDPGSDDLTAARTAGFTTLVFAQLFNTLNARSELTTAFHRLFVNRWLWGAILLAVLLQVAVVEFPFLQTAFGTASMTPLHWAVCVGMASLVLWTEELRKWMLRTRT